MKNGEEERESGSADFGEEKTDFFFFFFFISFQLKGKITLHTLIPLV